MTDSNYSRRTVEWVLKNLLELRQGISPDPEPSVLLPMSKKQGRQQYAYFEVLSGMAGIVELKLKECGLDGLMTKIAFVMGESDADLAKIARCSEKAVPRRIREVIKYISGKPKTGSYMDFRDHKKVR